MQYVLIVSAVYPPEPVVSARLSSDLYKALIDEGKSAKVIHPKPTRPNGFKFNEDTTLQENEIIAHSFTCPQSSIIGRFRESVSFGKACAKYIREHHEEIAGIYANTWPLGSQFFIVREAKRYSIPVTMHVQDVYPESLTNKMPSIVGGLFKAMLLPIDKYILKNSDKVIAISENTKTYLVRTRGIKDEKVFVVINWQDETEFLEYQINAVQEQRNLFTFMYMGNIGPVAGVDLLIDAFESANLKGARLVIAGSGSMKDSLKEKAKNNQSIEFWDVPNGKVPEIQSKADVMLLPIKKGATSSSIPSKLPAYMFSAKPIIGCMDIDSYTANAIRESGCGFIIEPENEDLLASKMKEIAAKDNKELTEIGKQGQEYALENFSKESNLNNLMHIVIEL